jgi:hypothetical protein
MEIAGFELISRFNMIFRRCQQSLRLAGFTTLIALLPVVAFAGGGGPGLKNAGFESANPADQWQIESSEARQAFTISADSSDTKDGGQSLQIAASQPVHLTAAVGVDKVERV